MLEQVYGAGIEEVEFPFSLPLVDAADGEAVDGDIFSAEGEVMFGQHFFRDLVEPHAFDAGSRAREIFVYDGTV